MNSCEQNGINLNYPFFANTYILYHAIEKKGLITHHKDNSYNKYSWDSNGLSSAILNIENCIKNDVSIFYASEDLIEKSIKSRKTKKDKNTINRVVAKSDSIDFTLYLPLLAFIPFDTKLYEEFYKSKNFEQSNPITGNFKNRNKLINDIPKFSEVKNHLEVNYSEYIIYSDTTEESKFIDERMQLRLYSQENFMLKVLFYSAPVSTYLLNQFPYYLPIYLDFINLEDEKFIKSFKTNIHIFCKNRAKCVAKNDCILKRKITEYHHDIFNKATEAPEYLADMYHDFISNNTELLPFHFFDDIGSFSKAITFYHYDETITRHHETISLFQRISSIEHEVDGISFTQPYNQMLVDINSVFLFMSLDYLLTHEYLNLQHSDNIMQVIVGLIEKSFLNGKYSFFQKNISTFFYLVFRDKLYNLNKTNKIELNKSKYNLSEDSIFLKYQSTLYNHLIESFRNFNRNAILSHFFEFIKQIKKSKYSISMENFHEQKYIESIVQNVKSMPSTKEISNSLLYLLNNYKTTCNKLCSDSINFLNQQEKEELRKSFKHGDI